MKDLTQGKPIKLIVAFTLPLIAGNLFQQLYSLSDTLIVGQTLGVKALAAVGAVGSLMFLILGFAQGYASGLAIITAQRFGAKDYAGVRQSMATSLILSGWVTLITTIVSLIILKPLLKIMQTPAEIFNNAFWFMAIILIGLFATMAYNVASNAMRAIGESRAPIIYLIIGIFANIILELIFILIFHWGVAGAAVATVMAQLIAALLSFWHIYKYNPVLQITRADLHMSRTDARQHLNAGLPMGFQQSIIAIGALILQSALNTLGTDAVAATTAAQRIDQIAVLPLMSFGVALATFTAQNYGAKEYHRILVGVRQAIWVSCAVAVVLGLGEIWLGRWLVSGFVGADATQVLDFSQQYFWAHGLYYALLAILFILRYTLQGLNDARTPTLAGIAELIMRAVAALALVGPFGFFGASLADMLAWIGSVAVLTPAYLKVTRRLKAAE